MSADRTDHRPRPPPVGRGVPRRIALITHGYPPRETAGTEQHVACLARGLARRGHRVLVLATTREPAARQYAWLPRERPAPGLTVRRLVQNMPARPLAQAERDRAVEHAVSAALAEFRPDLVHVHHLQFLSSGLRLPRPAVLTLHDQWLWCAAGGIGLLPDGGRCPGPRPERCARCASAWAPRPGTAARLLLATAGRLAGRVHPPLLHRAFRLVPPAARRRLQRPRRGAGPERPAAARARNQAMAAFARDLDLCLAPSDHLAGLATRHLDLSVEVLRHGVSPPPAPASSPPTPPDRRRGPILFLGTIAAHKGVDRVVRAWRAACPSGSPPLALHGPVSEPATTLGHPVGPILDRAGVWRALSRARLLVVASRWEENAPLVVTEARAAGCPVLAPRLGGLPELIEEGRDGWLFDPDDDDDLVRLLRCAIDHPPARSPRPPPTAEEQLDRLVEHYRQLLGGART